MKASSIIQNIPCTLVTGFLGSGKTTVINQLLSTKPTHERWALLINEFGRIGVDGALLTNAQDGKNKQDNIAIREVSGGCICCTSQLPLQIALTRLLTDYRPQRLIIEPTGLAHPRELIRQLSAPHWQTALSMQAVITVLSGVQWQQEKYRTHDGFQAHVRDADVLVINRYEQLSATCRQDLQEWVATLNKQVQIIWAISNSQTVLNSQKIIDSSDDAEPSNTYLSQLTAQLRKTSNTISQQRTSDMAQSRINLTLPNNLMSSASENTGNGIETDFSNNELPYRYHEEQQGVLLAGWRLPPHWVFNADKLQRWLLQLPNWQRIKGIVHTSDGWQQLNFTPDSLTINDTSSQIDARLEIILLSENRKDIDSEALVKDKDQQQANWANWDLELMALVIQ